MLRNSVALSAGTIVRLSVGFLTWLAAARLYPASEVGIAASAISAMMLCVQAGMLGVDLALIGLYPQHRQRPGPFLDTALTLGVLSALVAGVAFVGVADAGLRALDVLASSLPYAALFLLLNALQACWWMMDAAAVAFRRTEDVLVRAIVAASATLIGVVSLGALHARTAGAILASWTLAAFLTCALGMAQMARATGGHRLRPRIVRGLAGRLLSLGVRNFAITVADYAPGLILPIVVAEVVSPRAAAYWYAVWMMAAAAQVVPAAFGVNLFAEAAHAPTELALRARDALRSALLLAAAATAGLVAVGPLVLSILGPAYEAAGSGPLRVVALSALPMVVVKVYLATCRSTGRMLEGALVAAFIGAASVILAAIAARDLGLIGVAWAWLGVQLVGALLTGVRLRTLLAVARRAPIANPAWSHEERVAAP
jgi:O-antigen/teichoic acid export membrane protein